MGKVVPAIKLNRATVVAGILALAEGAIIWYTGRAGWWLVALAVVTVVELWLVRPLVGASRREQGERLLARVPAVLMGMSLAMVIVLSPRGITQVVTAGLFVVWRTWWRQAAGEGAMGLLNLLLVQMAVFEAIFLMAAIWRTPDWIILLLVWLTSYLLAYSVLRRRGERAAGVVAATWALVASEATWVFLTWLVSYVVTGGFLIVPQPALVLTAVAYCFGSIYVSQRQGNLSRGRLTEYVLIGLILIAIVITGTPWRGGV